METFAACAEEMRELLGTSELTGSRAFIHSFVKRAARAPGAATIRYTPAMPEDNRLRPGEAEEVALGGPALATVKLDRPRGTVLRTFRWEVSLLIRVTEWAQASLSAPVHPSEGAGLSRQGRGPCSAFLVRDGREVLGDGPSVPRCRARRRWRSTQKCGTQGRVPRLSVGREPRCAIYISRSRPFHM